MSRSRTALTLTRILKLTRTLTIALTASLLAAPLFASWDKGVAAYRAGRYDEATAAFRQLASRSPEAPDVYFMLGRSQCGQKRLGEAIVSLAKAVELGPTQASYRLALAQTQLKAGQPGEALNTLAKLEPKAIPGPMREAFNGVLAHIATATDRAREAYSLLDRALAADPKSKSLWVAQAKVADRLDQPAKRFTAVSQAFAIDTRDSELGLLAVHVAMGLAQNVDRSADEKRAWYGKAARVGRQLAAASPTPENLKLAGGAEMGAQEYEAAAESFEKALASGADDLRLHYDLGRSYTAAGRYDDALQHLQEALDKSPEAELAADIHAARGLVYRHLEELEHAAEAFRLAGDDEQAAEMTKYAENRREWKAAKADCVKKRTQIAELRQDSEDLKESAEWQELDREFTEVLVACEPYFLDSEDSGHQG